ncbi:uncharacterized protein LAJ45_05692 [Morchella importuna]|uniref:uncharacterized protein n=1 Tax=Morchella importuna TaxID=1174673 RepID=UPI001E8D3693|nr:uncharacterized protein LAJ45_05692 [Morchella importuna]KAH8150479.1 hypothetical protein LAJ45_05692 [Morchella importuna]
MHSPMYRYGLSVRFFRRYWHVSEPTRADELATKSFPAQPYSWLARKNAPYSPVLWVYLITQSRPRRGS